MRQVKEKIKITIAWIKEKILRKTVLFITIGIWVLFQFMWVALFGYDELVSDPGFYVYYAEECIKHGTVFPDYSNFHSEYIFSPGRIHFIIVWKHGTVFPDYSNFHSEYL